MPTIIPIISSSRYSAPMTEQDENTALGMLIVLTLIWIITSVIMVVRYLKHKHSSYHFSLIKVYFLDNLPIGLFHMMMTTLYVMLLLVLSGQLIGNLL